MFIKAHKSFLVRLSLALILMVSWLEIKPVQPVLAGTITVTNTNDSGAGSLRQAIASAVPGDTITFNSLLSGQTIALASTLVIDKNLTIDGSSLASKINISGNNSVRVFEVLAVVNATFNNLTIKNGKTEGPGGGIHNSGTLTLTDIKMIQNTASVGGAIFNNNTGTMNIMESTIGTSSATYGAGMYNYGTMTLINSMIQDNSGVYSGGIHNIEILTIIDSTISWNDSTGHYGAGISNSDTLNILNSTLSENFGNSIHNFNGTLTITNSTLSANGGSGVYIEQGILDITNSTIAGNFGYYGIATSDSSASIDLSITNSILYNDSTGEIYSPIATAIVTYSIVEGGYAGTGNLDVDPLLGSLQDNGGFTQTMALGAGSPALDVALDTACPSTDQRGMPRPQGLHCDIGAYEKGGTFWDVPTQYWSWSYIERLYAAGITGGCSTSPLMYCPGSMVTRDQMAVFLLKGKHGAGYIPPPATGMFADVPTNYWAAAWIEQLAKEGITSGCNITPQASWYCPGTEVTRDQMAVFLLKAKHASGYVPPAATGVFVDVPQQYWAAAWIEALAGEGVTAGCGNNNYCPGTPVTRDQMAVFLVRNFNLP